MVTILVEGDTDKTLIEALLKNLSIYDEKKVEFKGLKGIESIKKLIPTLEIDIKNGNKIFAIIDADKSFKNREKQMKELTKNQDIGFYIFPNHKDNGDLETLLLSNIPNDKFIQCFDKYKKCVGKDIDNKTKLYAYTTLKYKQKPKEYIKTLDFSHQNFDELKQKLTDLFKGID